MKHSFDTKVYYADTDAYGVVWHGSYLRWMEKGRVDYCEQLGLNLVEMINMNITLPITNMNIRFKSSAKLDETITIETWVEKYSPVSITFKQTIKSKETQKLHIEAVFDVVAINNEGKLYRRLPEILTEKLEKGLEKCPALV